MNVPLFPFLLLKIDGVPCAMTLCEQTQIKCGSAWENQVYFFFFFERERERENYVSAELVSIKREE